MQAIFISYRREDASGHAGRLFDDLSERLGKKSVFMDVAGIQPGRDFRKVIHQQVGECGVLLAVIGPRWLDARDSGGRRRLDNPADYVRLETATALQRDIPVVPVLVNGAQMMQPEDLPPELSDLAYRNAFEVRDTRWRPDIELLAVTLRAILEGRSANDTMTLRPLAAMPPTAAAPAVPDPEPAPLIRPAAAAPDRRAPLALWAGGGLALLAAAGTAFLALRPGTSAPPTVVPPEGLVAAATVAPAAPSAASSAAPSATPAASVPVAVAAASAGPAPASAAVAAAAAPASAPDAVAAASAPASLLAAASAAPATTLPTEPTAAGPAASSIAAAAPTPKRPPPSAVKPVAPAAVDQPPREPVAARAGSTLTVTGWKVSLGGCGGAPVAVKGVSTFAIEPAGPGVRVTQVLHIQDQGWSANITGEAHFDTPRPGRYELINHGEWTHVQGRRFRTEARVVVFSPDGLKAASARGLAIRTLCP